MNDWAAGFDDGGQETEDASNFLMGVEYEDGGSFASVGVDGSMPEKHAEADEALREYFNTYI